MVPSQLNNAAQTFAPTRTLRSGNGGLDWTAFSFFFLPLSRFNARRMKGGGAICQCDINGAKDIICRDALYDR